MFYFKNNTVARYLAAFLLSVLIIGGISFFVGGGTPQTTQQLYIDALLVALSTFIIGRGLANTGFQRIARLVDIYDDECDPYSFVLSVQNRVSALKPPYNEYAVWLMSPYAAALVDVGRAEEAVRIADDLRISAQNAPTMYEQASMLINMEPLVEKLFGPTLALPLLEKATNLMDADPVQGDAGRRDYAEWEMGVLRARLQGNDGRLVELLREVRIRPSCSWRLRVLCADCEAKAYRRMGDVSREQECLSFVVEHGNKLPVVPVARQRIAELDTRRERA